MGNDVRAPLISTVSPSETINTRQFFGVGTDDISDDMRQSIMKIEDVLVEQIAEPIDRIAVLNNLKMVMDFTDDISFNVSKMLRSLLNFKSIGVPFANFATTKDDLFKFAIETGNWMPFLKESA